MQQRTTDAEQSSVDPMRPTVAAVRGGPPPTSPDVSVPTGSATGRSGAGSTAPRPRSAPPSGGSSRGRSSGGRSSAGRPAMTSEGRTAAPTEDIASAVARLVASAPPLNPARRIELRMLLTGASRS
jgi:hypothetical protein